ncbi:hypothetical protein ABC502_02995 [Alkalimonas sp. NCh-2]
MKRLTLALAMLFVSSDVLAQPVMACGEVERLRVWASGSDEYGIWVEYKSNPQPCPGGFFLPHAATNKDFVYSLILSAKAAGDKICIQTYPERPAWKIGSRCRINYATHQ